MNQDKIMKRRMVTAIILLIITLIALFVFIGLYVDETRRVQETYRKQYRTELGHASEEISIYLEPEGDHDLIYERVSSYMSCAASFAFLIEDFEEKQVIINQLNTALIKYPVQMKPKMKEVKEAVDDILSDLDKGYDKLSELIGSLELKGN